MEAAETEAGGKNHLQDVLSESEFSVLPNQVVHKLNVYIDKKFGEYLTSTALHETSKLQNGNKIAELEAAILEITAKYEDAASKISAANDTVAELGKQVENYSADLEKARDKICRLENEIISIKSARDAAVDERNDLTRILQRRDTEIERLTANETSLSQQLRAAIDTKCEALAQNDEIQSKELALQYREKRIDQERTLLNSQIAGLTEEVNRLTSELQTVRLNNTSRMVNLETQLAEKLEELSAADDTITQLNELKKNLNSRAENLNQRLMEQRDIENKMAENYKKELEAKTKLADLFKTMLDDAEAKTLELTEGIGELQKLLNEATEKYGELETKFKQAELDHEEMIEKKNDEIESLKTELRNVNQALQTSDAQNLNAALNDLAPSAATASKLLKSGMSLTQIYSQLVKTIDDLAKEKEDKRQLSITLNTIVQELEEKAPMLQRQKAEHDEAIEANTAMAQQIESIIMECNRLRDEYSEASKIANHYTRENTKLKGELADLGRQVCFLLKEIEHNRGGLPNGDHETSRMSNATNSDLNSSRVISKTLVTFTDIQELQANNQKLLRLVRELTDKHEELEQHKEQFESGEMQSKIECLKNRVSELTEAQERQTKMVNGLIRQRDMFKNLYHDLMKGKRLEISVAEAAELNRSGSFNMDTSNENTTKQPIPEPSSFEIKYKETEKHLELLKEEFKTYKEEKATNERMLYDQIDNMRQEITKLTAANSKSASTCEYNNDRLKILQTNITTYKKQISSLEEKNKAYNATIAKQEVSLQHLRDEALNAQSKFSAAEIQVENLKLECKLIKDTEVRLQTEKEMMNRERQGQSVLLKNLELIKASLERVEAENRAKIESRLDEATRECSALRRRLQEEQDRFRELAAHLERQTETAKARMQEEKDAADVLRKDVAELREDVCNKNKSNEELAKKLKAALAPNTDGSYDTVKKIREMENKLSDKEGELKSLHEQLDVAKEHIKQYCDIAEGAEKELKTLNAEYETYKKETSSKLFEYSNKLQFLEDRCAELEAELSLHVNGEHSASNTQLKDELLKAKTDLAEALASNDSSRIEIANIRSEIATLSEAVQKAEEKYSHEMVLHSTDIQALTQAKEELSRAQNQLNELVALKNSAEEKLANEKSSWSERQIMLNTENEQLMQRLKDLNDQNSLLHDQVQALGTQLAVSHASRSQSESMSESANESTINISITEEDGKSSEQLFQIVKFLRKEKDIAMAKFDILQAETMRLKSQLEITEKQLDDAKLALATERERSEVSMVTVNKQSDILRKVETLNALTDSNRILREERDSLTARVDELTSVTKAMEVQLFPLQEKITDYTSRIESLVSENTALKADNARWRSRVNALVERANKISPEDWKRLQAERETLAKMLTNEKDNVKKLSEELGAIKVAKSKIEEQYTITSRQQNVLAEENKKLTEELQQVLKNDMARLTEEVTKLKDQLASALETNTKFNEEIASKDLSLIDIRGKEAQIRKIAKKYKAQYEELVKSVEEEKKTNEGQVAAADAELAEASKKHEDLIRELQASCNSEKEINDKLKQELESLRTVGLDKEEKAKQVLKQAKSKIVQLTDQKNTLSRELEESRSRIGSIEQSTRDEQDVRLALIKSQYEGRLSRLEKERAEAQAEKTREVEALLQKVNMLQRQLASQSSASKQQATTEKTTSEPPTANIKPMAGVAQQSVSASRRGGETPLASIRPMAQVGPTAPHDAHTTEYMPASSSRPLPRASVTASTAPPPESTQDMDTSEAGLGSSGASDSSTQSSSHSQAPQQCFSQAVAMVMPRMEQPSAASSASAAAAASSAPAVAPHAAPPSGTAAPTSVASSQTSSSVSTSHPPAGVSTSHPPAGVSTSQPPAGVSTSHPPAGVSTSHPPAGVSTSHPPAGVSTSHPPAGVSTSHPPAGVSTSHPPAGVSTSHPVAGVSTSQPPAGVSTSHPPAAGVSTSHPPAGVGVSTSHPPAGVGVSTSHAPQDTRPAKRRLQARPVTAKRTRVQGFERSVDVEYQVPTSSRCDQDDEGVIVVDSEEDDERCTGTMYREGEEDEEDMEEEQEAEAEEEEDADAEEEENATRQDSPAQSPEGGAEEGESSEPESGARVEELSEPPHEHPHPQIEAISSGTEPSGTLSLGGNGGDDADDSIVPSTPTLFVPRRNDGFGEAVVSPQGGAGGGAGAGAARFTFAEAAAGHHDTHADLAAALPHQHPTHADNRVEGGEPRNWEESRAEEEAAAVSSQGSEPSSPHHMAEEGREAEASAPAVAAPSQPARHPHPHSPHPHPHSPHSQNQRWMRADSESGMRGRGMRRGRPSRRSHNYMRF